MSLSVSRQLSLRQPLFVSEPLATTIETKNTLFRHRRLIHKLTRETRDQETLNRNLKLKHHSSF